MYMCITRADPEDPNPGQDPHPLEINLWILLYQRHITYAVVSGEMLNLGGDAIQNVQ